LTMPLTITGRGWSRDKECQADFVVVKGFVGCRKGVRVVHLHLDPPQKTSYDRCRRFDDQEADRAGHR
jgi:hypothetical protein